MPDSPPEPDGIFYGDQPALIDINGTISQHVTDNIPWDELPLDTTARKRSSQQIESPLFRRKDDYHHESPYPEIPAPKLGQWIIPTGCGRYGRCLLAFGRTEMIEIAKQAYGYDPPPEPEETNPEETEEEPETLDPFFIGQWGLEHDPLDLVFRYDGEALTRPMYALTPISVDTPANRGIWILPLVDARYFWQRTLRARDIELDGEDDWEILFSQLQDRIETGDGASINIETNEDENEENIHEDYYVPDQTFFKTDGLSIGAAIDIAALSVGLRPVYDGEADIDLQSVKTASKLLYGDAEAIAAAEEDPELPAAHPGNFNLPNIKMGGYVPRHTLSAELTLIVRKLHNYFTNLDDPYQIEVDIVPSPLPDPEEGDPPPAPTKSNSYHPTLIWSTIWADFQDNEITSISELEIEDLAIRIATDLADWSKNYHITTFAGLAPWQLSGFDDYMSIQPRRTPTGVELITTVKGLPADFMPRLQVSQKKELFTHEEIGLIFRSREVIPAATEANDPDGANRKIITPGSGLCVSMYHDREEGEMKQRLDSAGEEVEFMAFNFDPNDPVAIDVNLQAKQVDTMAVIDVEYCG